MRLLASTGPLFARPLDWAFGVIADAGYDGVELMITQDPATQDPERILAATRVAGIDVPVLHGPFLLLTRRVFGTEPIGKARRSLQLAGDVGADLVVVHPPYRWQRAFHHWLIDEAQAEALGLGTRVGVENLFPVALAGRRVRFHRYTRPEDLEPFADVVLDTSHLGVAEVGLDEAYAALRDKLAHLHVSDNRGGGKDSHAPLGHGLLPLGRFLHRIGEDERAGDWPRPPASITLELDCRRYLDDRSALVGYLRQEREKCLALLAGAPIEEVLGRPDDVEVAPGVHEDDPDQPTVAPDGT